MKITILSVSLAVAIFLALIVEELIPPIWLLHGARVVLVPMIFAYGALALPFLPALALAVFTGLLTDLARLHAVDGKAEIALGWSILFYLCFGGLCQGLRPLFLRGRWELPALMSLAGTVVLLASQFAMITIRRFDGGGFFFSYTVLWRILAPGILALLLAPLVQLIVYVAEGRERAHKRQGAGF